jgi:xylanolytic transcriptional activator XlnR
MNVDPHLHYMYRYFGTYLLQSSFIFLILAQKLGKAADNLILENCTINLQVLDTFVQTVNIDYQRTFARVLRETLSTRLDDRSGARGGAGNPSHDELDPVLLQYRWVAGYNGLWNDDMGVVPGANQRPCIP